MCANQWDNSVAETSEAVHPIGSPINHSTHRGFSSPPTTSGSMDPPIQPLQNRWLEKMEADSGAGTESMVFRVSGEVTEYRGKNYLLIRKVLIEKKLGQDLSK